MISAALLALDAHDAGERGLNLARRFDAIPRWQISLHFGDLCVACPHRMDLMVERRPANALNIEIGQPMARCRRQCPDGRGSAWLLSGGSPLAYGTCGSARCPLLKVGGVP